MPCRRGCCPLFFSSTSAPTASTGLPLWDSNVAGPREDPREIIITTQNDMACDHEESIAAWSVVWTIEDTHGVGPPAAEAGRVRIDFEIQVAASYGVGHRCSDRPCAGGHANDLAVYLPTERDDVEFWFENPGTRELRSILPSGYSLRLEGLRYEGCERRDSFARPQEPEGGDLAAPGPAREGEFDEPDEREHGRWRLGAFVCGVWGAHSSLRPSRSMVLARAPTASRRVGSSGRWVLLGTPPSACSPTRRTRALRTASTRAET